MTGGWGQRMAGTVATKGEGDRLRAWGRCPPWLSLILIAGLALAVRLVGLSGKSLWVDEADSFYFASQAFADILSRLCDPHPPGYYLLLRSFLAFGHSEFWVRLPSTIAGVLTVPLLAALGRELGVAHGAPGLDRRTGVLASLLLAVAPLHVWYSQEARMYSLVTFLGVCAVYFALRFVRRRRVIDALAYVTVASAALLTDQSAGLPLLLANLAWSGVWLRQRRLRVGQRLWNFAAWVGLQLIVGLSFWLWWSRALYTSLFDTGTLYQVDMVVLVLQRLGLSVPAAGLRSAFLVVALVLVVVGVLMYRLPLRRRWARGHLTAPGRPVPVLALAGVALFALITIASVIPRGFTVKRLVVSLWPTLMLIGAWAMRGLRFKPWLLFAIIAVLLALCVANSLLVPKEPWREVVAAVQQELGPNDELWVDELAVPAFDYYYSGSLERLILRTAHVHECPDRWATGRPGGIANGGRVWVVTRVDPYRNLLSYLPPCVTGEEVWARDWYHVSVRAYKPVLPGEGVSGSGTGPPSWLLAWPSPLDEACYRQE